MWMVRESESAGGLLGRGGEVMSLVSAATGTPQQLSSSLSLVPSVRSRHLDHGVRHKLFFCMTLSMTIRCLLSLAACSRGTQIRGQGFIDNL